MTAHVLGIGAASAASTDELLVLARACLDLAEVDPATVAAVATSAALAEDRRILALGWPVLGFAVDRLAAEAVPSPSARVEEAVGTASVAEAAALAGAGRGARLLVSKQRSAHATASLAATTGS